MVIDILALLHTEFLFFFLFLCVISDSITFQRLVEGYLLRAAQRSDIFAHILIWHLQVCEISHVIVYCFGI